MRSSWSLLCALGLLGGGAVRAEDAPAKRAVNEVSGARRVCEAGPSAVLARAQRSRGDAATQAADVLPNPSLVVEHQQAVDGTAARETTIGLSVSLGIGGRRGLLQDAAQARREQALADAHATLFESALAFREAFAAAVLDQARFDALSEQQAALDSLGATLQGLGKGGETGGYDILRQQAQARGHRLAVASAKARAEASRALLEAWLGEAVTLPSLRLPDLAGGTSAAVAAAPAGASADPPRVASLEASARASALEAEAARRRAVPDLQVFAGYRNVVDPAGTMGHGITVGVTVPLTFFDRGQGDAALAASDHAVAKAAADGLRRENAARAKASKSKLETLESSTADAEQTVTETAAIVAKAVTLYGAGEASITELLDAHRAAEEARLARIDLAEEIAAARLAKMRAAGSQGDSALDKACGSTSASAPAAGAASATSGGAK